MDLDLQALAYSANKGDVSKRVKTRVSIGTRHNIQLIFQTTVNPKDKIPQCVFRFVNYMYLTL